MSAYEWVDDSSTRWLRCRVCGFAGQASVLLRFEVAEAGWQDAATCPSCDSLDLVAEPRPFTTDDASVDDYVEVMGGVGTLAELIEVLAQAPGARLLDVGCGFGFAMDYARWRYGWSVTGIEPSKTAARRGATELHLDIRNEPLGSETDTGRPYPLVLSTEVLEHVTDPLGLLQEIARRMTPDGTLLLTTPDAAVVHRDTDPGHIVDVLSPGLHVFLASKRGLTELLKRAGFSSVRATRNGLSHRILARLDGTPPPDPAYRPDVTEHVLQYCRDRVRRVSRPSALSIGLLTRAIRTASALGQFDGIASDLRRVRSDLRRTTGVDLHDPARAKGTLPDDPPSVVLPIAFSLGMRELLSGRARAAVGWLRLAVDVGESKISRNTLRGSESRDLVLQAAMHLGLALARQSPEAAVSVALQLLPGTVRLLDATSAPLARWQTRIAVDLINLGWLTQVRPLLEIVEEAAPRLARWHGEDRSAGRDALLCMGLRAIQLGDAAGARRWLEALVAMPADASPEDRERWRTATQALDALGASPAAPAEPTVHSTIDRYWVDPSGTYLSGWIHVDGDPGAGLWLERDGRLVALARHRRDDLLEFWPDSRDVVEAGFEAYVPGPPDRDLTLVVETVDGERRVHLAAPSTRLPSPESRTQSEASDRLSEWIAQAPDGPVLVIGGRLPEADSPSLHDKLLKDREIVGLDIHPGHGVDVVGDAHRLSEILGVDRFALVYSASLLEHLAKPWIAAREMARVLVPGGLAVQIVPWAWPTHSQPNDFWRISEWGLRQLFDEELGFEAVDTGHFASVSIVPDPSWRATNLIMPVFDTASTSWIVARKIDDRAGAVNWPYDPEVGGKRAREYPLDGLATMGRGQA